MIKAIIFDLDGTLLDTLSDITNSINYVLNKNKYPTKTLNQVRKYLGYGSYSLVKDCLPNDLSEDEINKLYKQYVNHYTKNNNILTKPYDDILTLLKLLKANKYLIAITSNKMQEAVTSLNETTFLNLVDVAIGERLNMALKPDPEMIYLAIRQMGLTPEEVLFVGDTEVDLQTAKNAAIKVVAVTWGFRDRKDLLKENPDYIIDTPLDLLEIINRI